MLLAILATTLFTMQVSAQQTQHTADLVAGAKEKYDWVGSTVAERTVKANLTEECWTMFLDPNAYVNGYKWFSGWGYAIAQFAKHMGWDKSIDETVAYGDSDKKARIEKQVDTYKDKVSFTLDMGKMPCTDENARLMWRYTNAISGYIESDVMYGAGWKPKSGQMHIKMVMSNTVKDVAVTTDGKNFVVTMPYPNEPLEWDVKIKRGLKKGGSGN